jgi:hypothetical protein
MLLTARQSLFRTRRQEIDLGQDFLISEPVFSPEDDAGLKLSCLLARVRIRRLCLGTGGIFQPRTLYSAEDGRILSPLGLNTVSAISERNMESVVVRMSASSQ